MSWIIIVLISLLHHFSIASITKKIIKEPNVAGTWYPAKKSALRSTIKQLTKEAETVYGMNTQGSSSIRALIVPHAGYTFSGTVAAAAFTLIKGQKFDRIIILGPSHFAAFDGVAIPRFSHYHLPLGTMRVDQNCLTTLQASPLFHYQDNAFAPEHSVEAQLPFLSFFFPTTPIVPLVVGQLSPQETRRVAQQLNAVITPSTLVIVSTDMTHYGTSFHYTPFEGKRNIIGNIRQLDSEILQLIQHKDVHGLREKIKETKATVCGITCINILLDLVGLKTFDPCIIRCIAYSTSQGQHSLAENQPDSLSSFVTYASLIVTQNIDNMDLTTFEKKSLLNYARGTLEQLFDKDADKEAIKPIITLPLETSPGVFVTLYTQKDGKKELRGCIGNTASDQPLYQNVANMTRAAAFNDPRFSPLQKEELPNITLEISILQPPHAINSYKEIVLNTHGIILSQGNASALFLPKVPQEFGFDLEQTLTELSRKAGLPDDAWKSAETKFQVFETMDLAF